MGIPPEEKRDTKFFIDNYQSKNCVCLSPKGALISFCYDCYKILPEELSEDLKGPLNDEEYQWTWNRCYSYLKTAGRIPGLRG